MPHADVIYAVLGLVIFGGYTVLDFNRLRRADNGEVVQIAAGIFLDVINVFLFFLQPFDPTVAAPGTITTCSTSLFALPMGPPATVLPAPSKSR